QEFGRDGLTEERARAILSEQPSVYVIELAGIPQTLVRPDVELQLRKAQLTIRGTRPITPLSVELPTMGSVVTARMTFARSRNVSAEAGTAVVSASICDLRIQQDFKLRSMVYEGRLEL